ncbi:MAG: ferredoxin--NADP(+) reductase [Betaproteobacteria bacterium TMED156]|nr:MAG: ferredoxin--NADP(+) reductase [Betaproteobacteria bacterium TMED156]
MAICNTETVLSVKHWTENLFSFKTTRNQSLRFKNGHFLMIGIEVNQKPLLRAYSVVSPNYLEHLEFLSIKIPNGPLTSRLKFIKEGDSILVSQKSVGTLVLDDLNPGKRLYLFSTGTGLAPFMSIIRDPETYEKFEKIILVHGVRVTAELAYSEYLKNELPKDEFLGDEVSSKLIYYPTVTREAFTHKGRLTTAIKNGTLFADTKLPQLDPEFDRAMICGSPEMLKETSQILDDKGFKVSAGLGRPGDYVIERAFVGE